MIELPTFITGNKAKAAFRIVNGPVLVEDNSLVFHGMGKLPGPLIKWFLQELGNAGLCHLLDRSEDRSARASALFGYYDGTHLETFLGEANGQIALFPRGEIGFGWDPVFIPEVYTKTWGEMTKEEQSDTSMRRVGLRKLELFLKGKA